MWSSTKISIVQEVILFELIFQSNNEKSPYNNCMIGATSMKNLIWSLCFRLSLLELYSVRHSHAFKKLQMVFLSLSLHAFEVVSNILEKDQWNWNSVLLVTLSCAEIKIEQSKSADKLRNMCLCCWADKV